MRLAALLAAVQLLGYGAAALAFLHALRTSPAPPYFYETLAVYAAGAAALSALLFVVRSAAARRTLFVTKALLLTVLVYTAPDEFSLTVPLIVIALAETALRSERPAERILLHALLVSSIVLLGHNSAVLGVNVFRISAQPPATPTALQFAVLLIMLSTITNGWAHYAYRARGFRELARRQELSLENLSEFNQRLQRWAQEADSRSAERERNRISRELHDISGYMFTNLIALMDAAISTGNRDPVHVTELLTTARKQAQEGLQETRLALRKQRELQSGSDTGLRTIYKICAIFEQVTGTQVRIHFGNLPSSFDSELNHTLYRIVQESLTNAIRHGKATLVELQFWINRNSLLVNILDNGAGATEITKGIGLAGIEERITRVGGVVEAGSAPERGFRLHLEIPLVSDGGVYRAQYKEALDDSQYDPDR